MYFDFLKMECKVCWKVFITPQDAKEHYNIFKSHENFEVVLKNKPFECEFCKVRFNTLEDLNQHKKIHDKIDEVPETKEEEKKLRNKKEKNCTDTHKKTDNVLQNRSTKIFECDICGETFKQMKYLDTHTLTHKTNYKSSQSERHNRPQVSKKITRNDHIDELTNKITDKESLTQNNNNSLSKTEFFFEDTTSQVSDSADVKLVELNAKTIELSSSDDELNDEHYDEPDYGCDEEIDTFEAGKSCFIKKEQIFAKELDCDVFDNFNINKVKKNDEKKSIIPHIKIENNFDDNMGGGYESDDFPLDQLIKREKLKRKVKREKNSNAKNGEIKTETPAKPAKPRRKRTVKNETTPKVTNKRNSSKSKVEKNKVPKEEIDEAVELVIQPDIFFDKDNDTKKNLDNDGNNTDNPDNLPSKHKCSTCGERRSNKRLLQQHKQIHNGLGETECKVCRQVFGTPHDVLAHFDSFRKEKTDKHYQEGRPYQCKDCDSRFIHLKHLYEHRKIHIGDYKYVCKICGKSFLRKQGLQWHLETHLSEEMNAEGILNLQGVKVRENIKNKKLFVCDMCGHEFKQSSQLKIHINRHVKLKRFTCTVCQKAFVTPRDLLKHSRTHTGERPYKCAYCEKAFIDSGDKIKHERLHTGEKPYACKTCGKTFTFSSGLRTHERAVHFGLKRYNCDKCTRGFSNKSCLLKHKAKIHLQK